MTSRIWLPHIWVRIWFNMYMITYIWLLAYVNPVVTQTYNHMSDHICAHIYVYVRHIYDSRIWSYACVGIWTHIWVPNIIIYGLPMRCHCRIRRGQKKLGTVHKEFHNAHLGGNTNIAMTRTENAHFVKASRRNGPGCLVSAHLDQRHHMGWDMLGLVKKLAVIQSVVEDVIAQNV